MMFIIRFLAFCHKESESIVWNSRRIQEYRNLVLGSIGFNFFGVGCAAHQKFGTITTIVCKIFDISTGVLLNHPNSTQLTPEILFSRRCPW